MASQLGILGCGSVLWGPYLSLLEKLIHEGRVTITAVYDPIPSKAEAVAKRVGLSKIATSSDEVIENASIDAVGIFTSMNAHATLTIAGLEAGKHVLVEKPMATNLEDGQRVLETARRSKGKLICAPHILLSPTYQRMYQHVQEKTIGEIVSARARYGWAGPWWGKWFYEPGGGSLFDLGIYNVTSLSESQNRKPNIIGLYLQSVFTFTCHTEPNCGVKVARYSQGQALPCKVSRRQILRSIPTRRACHTSAGVQRAAQYDKTGIL